MVNNLINKNIKLGERLLDNTNLGLILPNWNEVLEQIELIRKTAVEVANRGENFKEREDFNNVISILGERGSGKSSVLITLRHKLFETKGVNEDIFLDVIVPEMLEDTSDILGVILLNLKQFIDSRRTKIDEYYKKLSRARASNKDTFDSCLYKEKTELDILWEQVFSLYIYRKKDYSKVIEENFSGVSEYSEERKDALISELKLTVKLHELFKVLINVLNGGEKGRHLIFVCFDDVDLNPKRSSEVLNVVLKYLNYPNIVTFISGDVVKFQEDMISEQLIKYESYRFINNKFVGNRTMLESQQELVYDFLKKIMPYSRRFELSKLTAQAKMDFRVSDDEDEENQVVTMKDLLGNFFYEHGKPYEYHANYNRKLKGNNVKSPVSITSFFQIFDDKPRGILNVYSYLSSNQEFAKNEYTDKEQKKNYNSEQLRSYYIKLFSMIIETNATLRKHKELVYELFTLTNNETAYGSLFIEIHHNKLRIKIEGSRNTETMNESESLLIIHFLYFIESMVTRNANFISGKEYCLDINFALMPLDNQRIIPNSEDVRSAFALFSELNLIFGVEQYKYIYSNHIYFEKYKEIINKYDKRRFSSDIEWLNNYDELCDNEDRLVLEIKNKILDDFNEFQFDTSLLDSISNFIQEYQNETIYNHDVAPPMEKEFERFEDFSLYFFFSRNINDWNVETESHQNNKTRVNIEKYMSKLSIIKQVIETNRYRMDVGLIRIFDKIQNAQNEYFDVSKAMEIFRIFKTYLVGMLDFLIKTRSKYNETILKNRVREGLIKIKFSQINIEIEMSEVQKEYISNMDMWEPSAKNNKKSDSMYTSRDYIDVDTLNQNDLFEVADGTEATENRTIEFLRSFEDIKGTTLTKSINAFKQFNLIHFHFLMIEAVDELLSELESSQIEILLYNIEQKYNQIIHIGGNNIDKAFSEELNYRYEDIKIRISGNIKNAFNNRRSSQRIFNMKNELLAKFETLEEQYHIHEVKVQQLNLLISKLNDEVLVAELKIMQRRILGNGSVNAKAFDTLINRMNLYLNSMRDDSFARIELIELAKDLIQKRQVTDVNKEINAVRNQARERIYQLELEELIKASAYLYHLQINAGAPE